MRKAVAKSIDRVAILGVIAALFLTVCIVLALAPAKSDLLEIDTQSYAPFVYDDVILLSKAAKETIYEADQAWITTLNCKVTFVSVFNANNYDDVDACISEWFLGLGLNERQALLLAVGDQDALYFMQGDYHSVITDPYAEELEECLNGGCSEENILAFYELIGQAYKTRFGLD